MKIVKLDINPEIDLAGVDAVALVEKPAIEEDFMYFSKHEEDEFAETYTDYPQGAVDAAKMGIKRNEALGNKCGTQVGKVRAQQLAQRKPISLDTVRRMRAFLIRQKGNYDLAIERKNYNACGYFSYRVWGGPEALPWAEKILRQAEGEEFAEVGPRGGIKESPKAPKSKTKNPDPKGEGTARGSASTTRGAKVDKATEESLKKKSDEFNEKYKDKLGYGANVGALKAVYQRGLGAYNTSRSPEVASRGGAKQWAMARVNAFLYLIKNGRPQNKKYTTDYDLLPAGHPKKDKFNAILNGIITEQIISMEMGAVGEVSGITVYSTKEEAIAAAEAAGCSGYHEHELEGKVVYMPCEKHAEATDSLLKEGFAALDEQQIVIGPLMKPNMLIKRVDEDGEPYFVYFTAETIKKIAYKMIKDKLIDRVNIEHDSLDIVDAYLVESWIIDGDNDKSKNYGFNLPAGTWMGMYKIEDKDIWDEYVKTGLVKGFSVEGMFGQYAMSKCKAGKPCACGLSESGMCDGSHLKK